MVIPIGDDNVKGGSYPYVSYFLLAINIIVFILSVSKLEHNVSVWGANPCLIESGQSLPTILTSMFMHGGIMHLIGNMLFLWIFADNVESTIGSIRFILFYISGGVVAALTHILISGSAGCVPMVGASGAIAAVMGAYLAMFPQSRIKMLFLVFIFRIPAFIFLGLWILEQVISGLSDIRIFSSPQQGGVAFWAHIGGFIYGYLMGNYFKRKDPGIVDIKDGYNVHQEYQTVKTPARRYNNRFFN